MIGIELDRSRYPLVIMHAGVHYTQADWNELMKGMIELIQRGPFGLINDTAEAPCPIRCGAAPLRRCTRTTSRRSERTFLASKLVGSSSFVNGVITALSWLKPYPHPVKVFATLDAAEDWVLSHFPNDMRQRITQAAPARAVAPPST